jgi:hypothetical protein
MECASDGFVQVLIVDMAWPPLEGMGRRQWKSGLSPDGTHWNCSWPRHRETGKTMLKHSCSVANHSDSDVLRMFQFGAMDIFEIGSLNPWHLEVTTVAVCPTNSELLATGGEERICQVNR